MPSRYRRQAVDWEDYRQMRRRFLLTGQGFPPRKPIAPVETQVAPLSSPELMAHDKRLAALAKARAAKAAKREVTA